MALSCDLPTPSPLKQSRTKQSHSTASATFSPRHQHNMLPLCLSLDVILRKTLDKHKTCLHCTEPSVHGVLLEELSQGSYLVITSSQLLYVCCTSLYFCLYFYFMRCYIATAAFSHYPLCTTKYILTYMSVQYFIFLFFILYYHGKNNVACYRYHYYTYIIYYNH